MKQAVSSPLLETTIEGASHVIINISGDISLMDANDAASYVQELAGDDANIIFGAMYDDTYADEAKHYRYCYRPSQHDGGPECRCGDTKSEQYFQRLLAMQQSVPERVREPMSALSRKRARHLPSSAAETFRESGPGSSRS